MSVFIYLFILPFQEPSKAAQPKGRARKAPRTVKAQTASDAPKPTKEKKAKEKTPKATSKSKVQLCARFSHEA